MEYQRLAFNFFADDLRNIEAKVRSIARKFIHFVIESEFDDLNELFKAIKPVRYSGQAYLQELQVEDNDKKIIFDIGYTNALLDMMQIYIENTSSEKEIDKIKTKYKKAVFDALMKNRIMFHKDLANAIGVSASGLNAVIKQMNASSVKAINVEDVSKYKLYSLTPVAYRYCLKSNEEEVLRAPIKTHDKQQSTYKWSEIKRIEPVGSKFSNIVPEVPGSLKNVYYIMSYMGHDAERSYACDIKKKTEFYDNSMSLKLK